MIGTGLGASLAAQHRAIDAGIKSDADDAALQSALALLRAHIHAEETALFPPLVQSGLAMPVFVMKREHGQMWPLIERLAAGNAAALQADRESLFRLLQMHNTKEEQIVYGAADKLAARDAGLATAVAAARMPDSWRCELAPH